MPKLDVIAIGASAGGLEPLVEILEGLPPHFPAAILVVVHTAADGDGHLARILSRSSKLPVTFGRDGEPVTSGRVYVAPPDAHLLVTRRGIVLNHGPRQNGFRPAIDPLFRSAAEVYGDRVMGIILSGALDDGTYGLKLIKSAGGMAVVQDPEEALVPGMPLSALADVEIDHVLPAASIARLIQQAPAATSKGGGVAKRNESQPLSRSEETVSDMTKEFGPPSGLTCPDCGGSLWEIKDGTMLRYRCHVGHQFSSEALDAAQRNGVEAALWTAVRALEEHSDLRLRMSKRAHTSGLGIMAKGFAKTAQESHSQAQLIRDFLTHRAAEVTPPKTPPPRRRSSASQTRTAVPRKAKRR